jgi:hypothetical protein
MTKHLYLLATIKTLDLSFCAGDRLVISEEYRRPTRKNIRIIEDRRILSKSSTRVMGDGTYLEDFISSMEMLPNDVRRDFELVCDLCFGSDGYMFFYQTK